MARRLRLTKEARSDLKRIRSWYRQPGSGATARARILEIEAAIKALVHSPCSPPLRLPPDVRLCISARHRITFRVKPDTNDNSTAGDVEVLRIYGPGQSDA